MTNAIDKVRALNLDSADEQMLDALNSVIEVIKSEEYNVAREKISFILQARRNREEIRLTRRLVVANWVLVSFTAVLALATIALATATFALVQAGP